MNELSSSRQAYAKLLPLPTTKKVPDSFYRSKWPSVDRKKKKEVNSKIQNFILKADTFLSVWPYCGGAVEMGVIEKNVGTHWVLLLCLVPEYIAHHSETTVMHDF